MENLTPPTVTELTDNAKKTADSFDKKPVATSFAVTVFILIAVIVYLAFQNDKLQSKLNDMAQVAFNNAIQSQIQEKVINVQADAISETKTYINDSIRAVDVKNFKGKIKTSPK